MILLQTTHGPPQDVLLTTPAVRIRVLVTKVETVITVNFLFRLLPSFLPLILTFLRKMYAF